MSKRFKKTSSVMSHRACLSVREMLGRKNCLEELVNTHETLVNNIRSGRALEIPLRLQTSQKLWECKGENDGSS